MSKERSLEMSNSGANHFLYFVRMAFLVPALAVLGSPACSTAQGRIPAFAGESQSAGTGKQTAVFRGGLLLGRGRGVQAREGRRQRGIRVFGRKRRYGAVRDGEQRQNGPCRVGEDHLRSVSDPV